MKKNLSQALSAVVAVICIGACCNGAESTPDAKPVGVEAAIKQAAEAKKHLYIFFYSEDDAATQAIRKPFEAVMAKLADVAQWTAVKKDAPADQALVEKFGLQAITVPVVLVLAPSGAVTTAGLAETMDEEKLRAGIATTAQQECLKALKENKVVVVCAWDKDVADDNPTVKAVNAFKADTAYAKRVEVVRIDRADAAEARFLKQLQIDPKPGLTTVMLGPPRGLLAKLDGVVTKAALEAAFASGAG
jgi:hypothetical protein